MDPACKLIARKMFMLCVLRAKGAEYQLLFERVMQYREPKFVPIKPYGKIGDRGNDGYIPSTGIYFQVYAPEEPAAPRNVVTAVEKAAEDFNKLLEHWSESAPVQGYRFVYNDRYYGSPQPVEMALATIRNNHDVDASVFLAKDLENEAMELDDDQLFAILEAPIPEANLLASIDFSVLRDVIDYILKTKSPVTASNLKAPVFEEKIAFNGLTSVVANLLTGGSYQSDAITDYFSKNSTFARQQLRDELASKYMESKTRIKKLTDEDLKAGDLVFFDLLELITPCGAEMTQSQHAVAQEAAIVVMAFYFEACDIFEDPNAIA
ncbi:MAG: hypothetical protein IH984_10195 [Planctomycetes bacterium]|nr:hypothetical protein [Planctomycetota bacterium]